MHMQMLSLTFLHFKNTQKRRGGGAVAATVRACSWDASLSRRPSWSKEEWSNSVKRERRVSQLVSLSESAFSMRPSNSDQEDQITSSEDQHFSNSHCQLLEAHERVCFTRWAAADAIVACTSMDPSSGREPERKEEREEVLLIRVEGSSFFSILSTSLRKKRRMSEDVATGCSRSFTSSAASKSPSDKERRSTSNLRDISTRRGRVTLLIFTPLFCNSSR
mmetsp:Transcript_34710/g.90013  ORF Transcript_34710/g.90013 Transcript_34710/m.90013 type:complete len:220 (+) Transcript_34710:221-880(+)